MTVLVATGTHRGNTDAELRAMLGRGCSTGCRVVNHDARDDATLIDLGVHGAGVPVWINREWVDADVRITTGFVEPHFFAGFSGGPKMVAPGLAGLDTVMTLHDARRIGDPARHLGAGRGQPGAPRHPRVRRRLPAAPRARRARSTAQADHRTSSPASCSRCTRRRCGTRAGGRRCARCPTPFDVVVTTGSGYPLDQNLYQAVKGMAAAERVVRPGGTIVLRRRVRRRPARARLVRASCCAARPRAGGAAGRMLGSPGFSVPDQWQVQVLARMLSRRGSRAVCAGLPADEVRAAHLTPVADVGAAVARALERHGPGARVCYLPEGPQTIPYVIR